tara:strand:+ start:4182 stop:5255 length:1074 start_codon:yes stop_codon:yes gene_type:complete
MNITLPSNSLISSIVAISVSRIADCNINIKNENLRSFNRLYSLNYFSKNYLDSLGIWNLLDSSKIIPYDKIEIYKNSDKTIEFNASDVSVDFLGYIVSEDDLVKNISDKVFNNIDINKTDELTLSAGKYNLNIVSNHKDIYSTKNSNNFVSKDYAQTALNITFKHSENNFGIPRQIFYEDEILGLLPIDKNRYNLIWSMPNQTFNKIKSLGCEEYEKLINIRAKFLLGNVSEINIGKSFSLSSRHANEYFYKNCFLIGESAHKFHPLAGLGLNMGIEDVATLTNLISLNYDSKKIAIEYCIKRMNRNNNLQKLLDAIISFHSSKIISSGLQLKILKLFNKTFFLKPNIIRNATGLNR